ncbi:ABC transporter ATP-binding protein [Rhodoligotrophos ferricapiens]|uniref:ABC transporter ATP-binding protein n=1 Tax=Rhodoligotrophos ferricapiens TaxID=3069264 RepID=UPI00315D1633
MTETPLLDVRHVSKSFAKQRSLADIVLRTPRRSLQAVRDVSFTVAPGETLGLVGESGCGKSTLGRAIAGFHSPTSGEIFLNGQPISGVHYDRVALSRRIQMIFQDPYSSLNPRLTVGSILAEVLKVHGLRQGQKAIEARVDELLGIVGLPLESKHKLPHAFSGGQRQRISIARALAAEPELIIADEPVSALDVSIQAQILNLFEDLQKNFGLAFLFIAHDLNVVHHISHRIAVMYLGEIVEIAEADTIFHHPKHPYTRALLSAIPDPDPAKRTETVSLAGELPDPNNPPLGCALVGRCPIRVEKCAKHHPPLLHVGDTDVRCFLAQ